MNAKTKDSQQLLHDLVCHQIKETMGVYCPRSFYSVVDFTMICQYLIFDMDNNTDLSSIK
jgi:hypothetical protein